MKHLFIFLSLTLILSAQGQALLEVAYNKTSSIVFPAVIKSVDRGSRDLLAQKAKGVENVLQLKAARENFQETNLTVITADGNIHQFTVNYAAEPGTLVTQLSGSREDSDKLIFKTAYTEDELHDLCASIGKDKLKWLAKNDRFGKMRLTLNDIYIHNDVIFYHLAILNRSNISYDVELLRFYIKDKGKIKRTASQETAIVPIYVFGNKDKIQGQSEEAVVFALEKFTIPDSKRLTIECFEKNGGRHLSLKVKNSQIVRARLL